MGGGHSVDLERSTLDVGHEGDPQVLAEATRPREIEAARQIRIDDRDSPSIEFAFGFRSVILADKADVDIRA